MNRSTIHVTIYNQAMIAAIIYPHAWVGIVNDATPSEIVVARMD